MEQIFDRDLGTEKLRQIAFAIKTKTIYGIMPTWIFDLENCGSELNAFFREQGRLLEPSCSPRQTPPELEKLRSAIVKIGGLCASGGFALSRDAICGILYSAIGDLEDYLKEKI